MESDESPLRSKGQAALTAINKLLQEKPLKEGGDFSAAVAQLSALRDLLVARHRTLDTEAGMLPELGQLNGVITVVIAGHYPLGKIPWPQIEKARDSLADLIVKLERIVA